MRALLHVLCLLVLSSLMAAGQTINLNNDVYRTGALTAGSVATLTGKSELHINDAGDPIPGCMIHLNSADSWVFFHGVTPATTVSTLLSRVRVNGSVAVADTNVRVVQHIAGAVVIPQPSSFQPLEIFTGSHLSGMSRKLGPYAAYDSATLGSFGNNIRSFILKRGYTATFAQNDNGSGISQNYVAQDGDLEVSLLPAALDRSISFIRIFPWRWTGKKGSCDIDPAALNADWNYNWSISSNSTRDWEYVAIKQQPYWPGLGENWKARGVNHLSGFNEPDNPVEDAYKNLSPQGSTVDAVAKWPDLLSTGLRVGAPAVTDGGYNWIVDFMNKANAAGVRVDYVPVHYYRSYANKTDPAGAANQLYNFLKGIHDATQRPIWVTEFNNGANWTDNAHDPDVTQNRNAIEAMANMMDSTPWIERYAVYSRVEWFRQTHYEDGGITPMGVMYRDHVAPMAHQQVVPNSGSSPASDYLFEGNLRDSRSGNNPLVHGSPTLSAGKHGSALSLDGTDDYLELPSRMGDSTDFSFAGWVKWGGGANWQRIFDFGTGTNAFLFLSPKVGSNVLRFTIKNGGGEQQLNHNAALPVNVWTHVAVTLTGTTGKLFVNGALVATNSAMDINPDAIGTNSNFIGESQFAADPLFKGQLDDLRFFTTALGDAQVAALAGSTPPQFSSDLVVKSAALKYQPYVSELASDLSGGTAIFSKVGGPAWLAVAADGKLAGVPGLADGGVNSFLVSATTAAGTVETATLQVAVEERPGLSARYAFNGNALASVGPGQGTASGGLAFVTGMRGQAIDLDGTDDFVGLPAGVATHDEITVASWVNWDGGNDWQRIFDFGNGTEQHFFLSPKSGSNRMLLLIRKDGVEQSCDTTTLALNQWVHVAATIGGGAMRLFVNGMQASSVATALKASDIQPAANFIGDSQFAADPLYNGRIDEFQIYNKALSAAEITAVMNGLAPVFALDSYARPAATIGQAYERTLAGLATDPNPGTTLAYSKVSGPRWLTVGSNGRLSGVPSGADAGLNRFIVRATDDTGLADDTVIDIHVPGPADLLAHYSFNNSTADNRGGAAAVNFGVPVYGDGVFERALQLDGTDDYSRLSTTIVNGLHDVTFAARVFWDGGNSWQRIFDFGNNTTQYMVLTPKSGANTLRFTISMNGNVAGSEQVLEGPALPVGEWSHVAVTLSGTTGTLYLNGAAVDTGTVTLDPADFSPTLNYIGKSQYADPYFKGLVDDFRIYSRGLDAGEVSVLAVPPPAVIVSDPSYEAWVQGISFLAGEGDAEDDPDGDGRVNLLEYLAGADPLVAGADGLAVGAIKTGAQLGGAAVAGKHYLSFSSRVKRVRPGVSLIPEGAATLEGLALPAAAGQMVQAGAPLVDGEFETITWYYSVAIEDGAKGFVRLRVVR
ncbi:LamG-like jellyroll fold domain-containing protein [Luteolibacter sp. Populi]|uniref:LamG-like jellyroll fold domain-containing protein n=1 Tax=Luteolibacter sp. Populi TaxID=3230487 RepID=UPI003465E4EC